jgi:hypothetical protein
MAEQKLTNEETAALNRIEAELNQTRAIADGSAQDLCKIYSSLKPALEVLVKFLEKIPGFGKKAAAAIAFLMKIADTLCPA